LIPENTIFKQEGNERKGTHEKIDFNGLRDHRHISGGIADQLHGHASTLAASGGNGHCSPAVSWRHTCARSLAMEEMAT